MKHILRTLFAAAMLVFGSVANAVDLTVYTAVETEDLKRYAAALNRDHPDINIKWVRGTTGVITSPPARREETAGAPMSSGAWPRLHCWR